MDTENPFLPKLSINKWKPDEALIDEVTKLQSKTPEFMPMPNPAPPVQPQFLSVPTPPKPKLRGSDFRIP